jgi:hypothetical protein
VPCKKTRIKLLLLQVQLMELVPADLYMTGEGQEDILPQVCC